MSDSADDSGALLRGNAENSNTTHSISNPNPDESPLMSSNISVNSILSENSQENTTHSGTASKDSESDVISDNIKSLSSGSSDYFASSSSNLPQKNYSSAENSIIELGGTQPPSKQPEQENSPIPSPNETTKDVKSSDGSTPKSMQGSSESDNNQSDGGKLSSIIHLNNLLVNNDKTTENQINDNKNEANADNNNTSDLSDSNSNNEKSISSKSDHESLQAQQNSQENLNIKKSSSKSDSLFVSEKSDKNDSQKVATFSDNNNNSDSSKKLTKNSSKGSFVGNSKSVGNEEIKNNEEARTISSDGNQNKDGKNSSSENEALNKKIGKRSSSSSSIKIENNEGDQISSENVDKHSSIEKNNKSSASSLNLEEKEASDTISKEIKEDVQTLNLDIDNEQSKDEIDEKAAENKSEDQEPSQTELIKSKSINQEENEAKSDENKFEGQQANESENIENQEANKTESDEDKLASETKSDENKETNKTESDENKLASETKSDENKETNKTESDENKETNEARDDDEKSDENKNDYESSPLLSSEQMNYEEDSNDYSARNAADISTLRSNSFRDIKSMIPRGYGKMNPTTDFIKEDKTKSTELPTKSGLINSLEELRQRHAQQWKVLGYDPSHGKGDMRGSVTLANFSPLKLIRDAKLWEEAQNAQQKVTNVKSSVPKQVLQSYSLCIKPHFKPIKRVNSSNEPLNLLIHPHSNSGNEDNEDNIKEEERPNNYNESDSYNTSGTISYSGVTESDNQFQGERLLPFKNDANDPIFTPGNSSSSKKASKNDDDDDDGYIPEIMTAASLLNGPDFFKDDDSDEYIIVEEEEEEEEEEEFNEHENIHINNNNNNNNRDHDSSDGIPNPFTPSSTMSKKSHQNNQNNNNNNNNNNNSNACDNFDDKKKSCSVKKDLADYDLYDDPSFDWKKASRNIPDGLKSDDSDDFDEENDSSRRRKKKKRKTPKIKIGFPKTSIVRRALCGESMSKYPVELSNHVVADLRRLLEEGIAMSMVDECGFIDQVIKNIKNDIEKSSKKSKQFSNENVNSNSKILLDEAKNALEHRTQQWEAKKRILETERELKMEEIQIRYEEESNQLAQIWQSNKKLNQFNKPSPTLLKMRQQVKIQLQSHKFEEASLLAQQMQDRDRQETEEARLKRDAAYKDDCERLRKKFELESKSVNDQFDTKLASLVKKQEEDVLPFQNRVIKYNNSFEEKKLAAKRNSSSSSLSKSKPELMRPLTRTSVGPIQTNAKLKLPPLNATSKPTTALHSRRSNLSSVQRDRSSLH